MPLIGVTVTAIGWLPGQHRRCRCRRWRSWHPAPPPASAPSPTARSCDRRRHRHRRPCPGRRRSGASPPSTRTSQRRPRRRSPCRSKRSRSVADVVSLTSASPRRWTGRRSAASVVTWKSADELARRARRTPLPGQLDRHHAGVVQVGLRQRRRNGVVEATRAEAAGTVTANVTASRSPGPWLLSLSSTVTVTVVEVAAVGVPHTVRAVAQFGSSQRQARRQTRSACRRRRRCRPVTAGSWNSTGWRRRPGTSSPPAAWRWRTPAPCPAARPAAAPPPRPPVLQHRVLVRAPEVPRVGVGTVAGLAVAVHVLVVPRRVRWPRRDRRRACRSPSAPAKPPSSLPSGGCGGFSVSSPILAQVRVPVARRLRAGTRCSPDRPCGSAGQLPDDRARRRIARRDHCPSLRADNSPPARAQFAALAVHSTVHRRVATPRSAPTTIASLGHARPPT